jgi:tryptophanyl-tRNA synthetase
VNFPSKLIEDAVTEISRLPGIDGSAKMSKSLNNAIYLSDPINVLPGTAKFSKCN